MRARNERGVSKLKILIDGVFARHVLLEEVRVAAMRAELQVLVAFEDGALAFSPHRNSSRSGANVQVCDMRRTWPRVRMFSGNVAWLPSALATVIVAGKTFVLFGLRSLFTVLKSAVSVNSSGVSLAKSARPSAAFLLGNRGLVGERRVGVFRCFRRCRSAVRCCAEPATDNTPEISTATNP